MKAGEIEKYLGLPRNRATESIQMKSLSLVIAYVGFSR
jgi:hypothetical protein